MNAKDILSRRFEKATFNGNKTDDVDEFLREVSSEYSQLQKDKNELERKLEVLADKIREYRDDEDALKDALLRLDVLHGANPDYFLMPWRRFFARARLRRSEYAAFMGLCRQIRWKVQK